MPLKIDLPVKAIFDIFSKLFRWTNTTFSLSNQKLLELRIFQSQRSVLLTNYVYKNGRMNLNEKTESFINLKFHLVSIERHREENLFLSPFRFDKFQFIQWEFLIISVICYFVETFCYLVPLKVETVFQTTQLSIIQRVFPQKYLKRLFVGFEMCIFVYKKDFMGYRFCKKDYSSSFS